MVLVSRQSQGMAVFVSLYFTATLLATYIIYYYSFGRKSLSFPRSIGGPHVEIRMHAIYLGVHCLDAGAGVQKN